MVAGDTVEKQDKAVGPIRQGERDHRFSVMLLSEDNMRRSTDVFPIKFTDIQQFHHVLAGREVLSDLQGQRSTLC